MTYTATGRLKTETDANNNMTTYLYDSQDRVTTVQFPNGTTNLYSYNSQGNETKFVDGRGNATTYSYDAMNRETGSTDALNDRHDADLRLRWKPDQGPGADPGRSDCPYNYICI